MSRKKFVTLILVSLFFVYPDIKAQKVKKTAPEKQVQKIEHRRKYIKFYKR